MAQSVGGNYEESINTPLAGKFPARKRPHANFDATDNESGAGTPHERMPLAIKCRERNSHVCDARSPQAIL
eukprot:4370108-Pleurochrysis_carterae.AAC.1